MIPIVDAAKSYARVKVWILDTVLLVSFAVLRIGKFHGATLVVAFSSAFVAVFLFYFIRCERCKTPLFEIPSVAKPSLQFRFLAPEKRCPSCGMLRI
jgi:hypothetical protein